MKTARDMMESGEWPVPCQYDDGTKKRFRVEDGPCTQCMTSSSDASPYCWGDDYAEIKAQRSTHEGD